MIMKTDNSQELQLASQRPRRANGVVSVQGQQAQDPRRACVLVQI